MPRIAATRTWRKSEWYMRPSAGRDAGNADVVIAGHPARGGTTYDTQERRRAFVGQRETAVRPRARSPRKWARDHWRKVARLRRADRRWPWGRCLVRASIQREQSIRAD